MTGSLGLAAAAAARFRTHQAVIGVAGLGYVGLPLALRCSEAGFRVIGFEIDAVKAQKINSGNSYINYIPDASIAEALERGFGATCDFRFAHECDSLLVCVPTPLNAYREPDLSYVIQTIDSLIPYLHPGQLISLESTTWPGTTEEIVRPRLEQAGFRVGEDLFLVFSPERQDPGNVSYATRNIPKLVGGVTPACLGVGVACYSEVIETVVPVSSTRVAEMAKLLENIHRSVNIGLVNELKLVTDRMGIDIFEVIDAAATKPFGFVPYYPGPGLGGHCIPIDPFYLTWKARSYGINTRFIELAGEINHAMPEFVVKRTTDALNSRKKAVNGSKIMLLGMAYKKNIDDLRESPSLELIDRLQLLGASISYSDPHIPSISQRLRCGDYELSSQMLTPNLLQEQDCVLLATNHDCFDYQQILEHAPLIVDTRGVYRAKHEKVVKA
jgi:UDP-N-acetyl-D-glucosamine dehydrogenase